MKDTLPIRAACTDIIDLQGGFVNAVRVARTLLTALDEIDKAPHTKECERSNNPMCDCWKSRLGTSMAKTFEDVATVRW